MSVRATGAASTRARSATGGAPRTRVHATGWRWPTSISTSCRALLGGRLAAPAARARCASAARDYLGDRGNARWTTAVRDRVAAARRRAPRRARSGCSPSCARSGVASTRSASTTASTPADEHAATACSPRSRTRRGASATPTCSATRAGSPGRAGASTSSCTSRRSWAWTTSTTARATDARARRCRSTSRASAEATTVFDATLALHRRELTPAAAARLTRAPPGGDAARARAIYGHAVGAQAGRARASTPTRRRRDEASRESRCLATAASLRCCARSGSASLTVVDGPATGARFGRGRADGDDRGARSPASGGC